jgi:RNA polymerase sigma-70 factor (sigma-E family)
MADGVEFDEFVRARSHHLLRVAYLLTGDHAHAEDLLQTALARSWPAWRRIQGDPEPYVRRVLVNTFNSWWRRRWHGELPSDSLPERAGMPPQSSVDDRDEIWRALLRLPRQQRAVLVLRYLEDLSEAQTAEVLAITVGAVKTHASRALARLRVDPGLTGLPLPETEPPAAVERVVAVRERVKQRRRNQVLMVGAACAVVVALILGYALAPGVFHRTLPPTERKIGVFWEYSNGYHVVAAREVPFSQAGRATITWRLTSLDYRVETACVHGTKGTLITSSLEIAGDRIGGVGCAEGSKLRPSGGARVGSGDPDAQHACVVLGAHRIGGDVGGQPEGASEGAVAHLAEAAAAALLGALVTALAAHDQPATLDLDDDVVGDVETGQLQPDHGVVAVAVDLGGGGEARRHARRPGCGRAEGAAHQGVELRERVPAGPQRQGAHVCLLEVLKSSCAGLPTGRTSSIT